MLTKADLLVVALLLQAVLTAPARADDDEPNECGLASVYASTSEETASGEDTRPEDFTAAHKSLPFGTLVRVDDQESGRAAVVRITDRGPFIKGRIIDVSQVAARQLGFTGLTRVCIEILWNPETIPLGDD